MAANARKPGAAPGDAEFAASLARFTAMVNRIAANSGANSYELRNEILFETEKERVRYENGRTLEGCSAERLFEHAKRASANHRRTLARNPQDTPACRVVLQTIKKKLVDGSFPWRQE